MKKKYDIKTTDVETLKKWYHLMTLGRALDEKAPSQTCVNSVRSVKDAGESHRCKSSCTRNGQISI